jgi:hypothetical protein
VSGDFRNLSSGINQRCQEGFDTSIICSKINKKLDAAKWLNHG